MASRTRTWPADRASLWRAGGSRRAALAAVALGLLVGTGCAQPGQLGHPPAPAPVEAPAPPVATPPPPPPEPVPALLGSGRLPERVTLRTQGPAQVVVRTEVLAPGESSGWHRHPGTETAVVVTGTVVLQRAEECDRMELDPGDAVFVRDAEPHVVRNEGQGPAELVVTRLLAPETPERESVASAC